MRLFGFTINARKEPRWVTREEFMDLYAALQGFSEQLEKLEKRAEANRVRISQRNKQDTETAEAEALFQAGEDPGEATQDPYAAMLLKFKEEL